METRTREKGTIDRKLRGSVGMLGDANPTRLSKRSQAVPLQRAPMPSTYLHESLKYLNRATINSIEVDTWVL